jgi:hypothetical protein
MYLTLAWKGPVTPIMTPAEILQQLFDKALLSG